MKPIRLSLAAETKVLSEKERTCSFVASDQTVDCYGEIVRVAGWKFERFAKNAPFVDSHNYSSVASLLGNVTGWGIEKGQLVEPVKFVPEGASALADFAFKMVVAGFLRAVSVGFMPVRVRSRWRDEKDFAAALQELGIGAEQAKQLNCIHWDQDQTELSAVLIGANPSAVALAHRSGAVADEDLASIGFADDDMTFLHEAADGWKNADAVLRKKIRAELRGIMGEPRIAQIHADSEAGKNPRPSAKSAVSTFASTTPTPPATKGDAAAGEQDAHARRDLLADLRRLEAGMKTIPAPAAATNNQ